MAEAETRSQPLPTAPPQGLPVSTVGPNANAADGEVNDGRRPWWGLGDVMLGIPFILIAAFVGAMLGLPFSSDEGTTFLSDADAAIPMVVSATGLFAQQGAQAIWPFVVSRWKGLGATLDWRLDFKPVDLAIGFGTAIIAVGLAAIAATVTSNLVDLADDSEADNTQFLRDAESSGWLLFFIYAVVVVAPVAEELFFRGLTLRAFEKRAGPVVAVIGSTVLFTLPHYTGGTLAGTTVLFASIGVVGAVLGAVTIIVGRIWPAVFAHMLFNSIGAAGALGAFDTAAIRWR